MLHHHMQPQTDNFFSQKLNNVSYIYLLDKDNFIPSLEFEYLSLTNIVMYTERRLHPTFRCAYLLCVAINIFLLLCNNKE